MEKKNQAPRLKVVPGKRKDLELELVRRAFTKQGVSAKEIEQLKPKGKLSVSVDDPHAS